MPEREVADLAAAVADGDVIDWPSAQSRLSSPRAQSAAQGLEALSHLSAPRLETSVQSRRLPLLLECARLIAIICCAVGVAGFAQLLQGPRPIRGAILLVVLTTFASAAVYLDVGGKNRRARALAACYWTSAASFSARGIVQLAMTWPGAQVLQVLAALRPEAFFAACLWQFAREFPAVTRFGRLDRVCHIGLRIALTVGAALFVANLVPLAAPGSWLESSVAPYQRLTEYGRWFWNLVFGMAVPALIVIARRGRLATGSEHTRARLFMYSVAFSVAPMMCEVLAEGLFPSYGRMMQSPRGFIFAALIAYPPMIFLPAGTAYAVAAENVLGVRVAIQRGLRYLLARWLLMWGAAVPLALLLVHLYRKADQPLAVSLASPPAPALLWFAGIGIVMVACRTSLIRALDRWALPGVEDRSAMLAHMTSRMKQARTPLEVAFALAEAAERALQAPANAYLCVDGALVSTTGGIEPPRQSAISVLLEGSREPCIVSSTHRQSYYSLMTEDDRKWIDLERLEIIVPILSGRTGGGLLGAVAFKSRKNALAFSRDDLRLLRAGASAASLACDAVISDRPKHAEESGDLEEVALQCARCGRVEAWTAGAQGCPCGGRQEPAALPKRILSRFEINQRLGAGGMGVVYRATDLVLGRDVAVKTLPRLSEEAATRLLVEARTMAGVAHSHVAVLFGAERWRGTPLLIMEYLSGGTLAARLQQGPLSPAKAIAIVQPLASALEHIHKSGLYHGDIKPSNVGVTTDGVPKFLDFGLSRAVAGVEPIEKDDPGDFKKKDESIGGTFAYLSPEVRDGAPAGPALDLWALCLVLCETVLGRHPFVSAPSHRDIADGVAQAVATLKTSADPRLGDLIGAALSLNPSDRPKSAHDLSRALASINDSDALSR